MSRLIVFLLTIIWSAIFYRYVSFPVYLFVLFLLFCISIYLTFIHIQKKIKGIRKSYHAEYKSPMINVPKMAKASGFKLVEANTTLTEVKLASKNNYFTFGETIFLKFDKEKYTITSVSSFPISNFDNERNRSNVEKVINYLKKNETSNSEKFKVS